MKSGKYRLQVEAKFNASLDNLSLKLWSRHNAGGDASNRYGGFGVAFGHADVDCKEESYHNVHITVGNKSLSKKIPDSSWVGLRYDCELQMPSKKFIADAYVAYDLVNFEKVASFNHISKASGVNDTLPELYCWIRTNGLAKDVGLRKEQYIKLA